MPTTSRPPGKHWAKMLCTMKGSRALGKSPSYTGMTPNPDNSQIHHASLPCYAVPREHRGPQNQPLWSQPCLTWWSRAPRGQPSIEGAVHRGVKVLSSFLTHQTQLPQPQVPAQGATLTTLSMRELRPWFNTRSPRTRGKMAQDSNSPLSHPGRSCQCFGHTDLQHHVSNSSSQ